MHCVLEDIFGSRLWGFDCIWLAQETSISILNGQVMQLELHFGKSSWKKHWEVLLVAEITNSSGKKKLGPGLKRGTEKFNRSY